MKSKKSKSNCNFSEELKKAAKICTFDAKSIDDVSKNGNVMFAWAMIIVATIVNMLLYIPEIISGEMGILQLVSYSVIGYIGIFFTIHLVAKLFGSKESMKSFFLPFGYMFLLDFAFVFRLTPGLRTIVDMLLTLVAMALLFVIVKRSYKFSYGRTTGLVLTSFGLWIGVLVLAGLIIGLIMNLLGIPLPAN